MNCIIGCSKFMGSRTPAAEERNPSAAIPQVSRMHTSSADVHICIQNWPCAHGWSVLCSKDVFGDLVASRKTYLCYLRMTPESQDEFYTHWLHHLCGAQDRLAPVLPDEPIGWVLGNISGANPGLLLSLVCNFQVEPGFLLYYRSFVPCKSTLESRSEAGLLCHCLFMYFCPVRNAKSEKVKGPGIAVPPDRLDPLWDPRSETWSSPDVQRIQTEHLHVDQQ